MMDCPFCGAKDRPIWMSEEPLWKRLERLEAQVKRLDGEMASMCFQAHRTSEAATKDRFDYNDKWGRLQNRVCRAEADICLMKRIGEKP